MALPKIKRSDLEFGDVLGQGGHSIVFHATWKKSIFKKKREVAAKKLMNNIDPNELEIMSKLDHANIVKLLGVIDDKPEYYLIMELCKGGSLRNFLNKQYGKRLPKKQFYDWAMQTARPLEYLKQMCIVHKDIKADNYVITENDILKLTDFGLAKEINVTSNASETGTYGFMTQELMKECLLSPTYDIYSYGVVLWELYTTFVPFKGVRRAEIIWKICHDKENLDIPPDCPEAIANLMRRCWQEERWRRPNIEHIMNVIADAASSSTKLTIQKQILEGQWTLETKFGEDGPGKIDCPCGVAATPAESNLCITVADNAGRLEVYSQDGQYKFHLECTEGIKSRMKFPHSVVAICDGIVYVTYETQYFQIFSVIDGWSRGEFVAISPDGKSSDASTGESKTSDTKISKLCGIAKNPSDEIFVGEITKKYISKHNKKGQHIHSFKVDIAPYSLAVTPQENIIISDIVTKMVHITEYDGQLLHHIKPPTNIRPCAYGYGIAFSSDLVFVCNHHYRSICCFSLSGDHLGCLPIEIPSEPSCLTFTPNGKRIIVTYGDSDREHAPLSGVAVYKLCL